MNCKPGDLAIVVRSRTASNLGKIVHVLKPYENRDSHIISLSGDCAVWLCRTTGSPLRWAGVFGIEVERSETGPIPDGCLHPLRPGEELIPAVRQSDAPVVA
jgi:hypothetical protein